MIYGLILGIIGTFFEEVKNSIKKYKTQKHHFLKIGVISSFFAVITFLLFGLHKYYFSDILLVFNQESIILLIVRLISEILQAYFTILAIQKSDRSTFSIVRILTIPLLAITDIILGYQFTTYSLIGIGIIVLSFVIFNTKIKSINHKGIYFVLFTSINAVVTISLFKYSITHYGNSVEIDQFIMYFGIFIFFLIYNYVKNKECALKLIFKEKEFIYQGLAIGIAAIIISYSYLYLNAAEATTIKRGGEMLWSIIIGFLFFKEKNFSKKILFAVFIIIGLILMVL